MKTSVLLLLFVSSVGFASEAVPHSLALGKKIYESNCIACHGASGDGRGPAAVAIPGKKPRNFLTDTYKYGSNPKEIFKTVSEGIPGSGMPPWKSALSVKEREAVVRYLLSFKKPVVTQR